MNHLQKLQKHNFSDTFTWYDAVDDYDPSFSDEDEDELEPVNQGDPLLPWWLRHRYRGDTSSISGVGNSARGLYTEAYPVLYPYHPLPTTNPAWIDVWAMQPYHGFWWG